MVQYAITINKVKLTNMMKISDFVAGLKDCDELDELDEYYEHNKFDELDEFNETDCRLSQYQ